jgi:hypothetical protein
MWVRLAHYRVPDKLGAYFVGTRPGDEFIEALVKLQRDAASRKAGLK